MAEQYADKLRAAQLETWQSGIQKAQESGKPETAPVVKDDNPPGTEKNYKALTKVWMPLILDQVGQTPWTVEEVLEAMMPIIKRFAREYEGLKGSYTSQDAFSDGQLAVLDALEKDGGRSPFAYFAGTTIKRSIQRGVKKGGFIPTVQRKQTYGERGMTSMDKQAGEEESMTIGKTVSADTPKAIKKACPKCSSGPDAIKGDGKRRDEQGNIIKGTCPRCQGSGQSVSKNTSVLGKCPTCAGKGSIDLPCERCEGIGQVVAVDLPHQQQYHEPTLPTDILTSREQFKKNYALVSRIITAAELSPRQLEAYLLKFGIEGVYDQSIPSTYIDRGPTEISRILGVADAIYKTPTEQPGVTQQPSGIWAEAQKQGKEKEFQAAWDAAFGNMVHKPFDPDIPTSFQIAPLVNAVDDAPYIEGHLEGDQLMIDMMPMSGKRPDPQFKQTIVAKRASGEPGAGFAGVWALPTAESRLITIQQQGDKILGRISAKAERENKQFEGQVDESGKFKAILSVKGTPQTTGNMYGDKLDKLILLLRQNVADIAPSVKAKQFAINQLEKALERIREATDEMRASGMNLPKHADDEGNVEECVNIIHKYQFSIIMEEVRKGTIDSDELNAIAYLV